MSSVSATISEPITLLDYAQRYIDAGWAVLPLHGFVDGKCTCGKSDCVSPGKHPRVVWPNFQRGVQDATHDLNRFRQALEIFPGRCNIGIRPPEDVLVIDVDPRNGGEDALENLEQRFGRLPDTVEQLSGGGGRHIVLRLPEGTRPKSGKLGAGLDVKTATGYIVAEPSVHPSGRQYGWEASSSLLSAPDVALAPTWLLAASPSSHPLNAALGAPDNPLGVLLPPPRRDRVRQALSFIPSHDRDEWVRFAHALKPYAEGRALWLEWSAKSDKFNQDDADRVWASVHSRGDVRIESIFKRAVECGWERQQLKSALNAPGTAVALPRLQRANVDFATLRAVPWVIEGFIASGEVHCFAGQPGVGKTTLFAALALIVAGYGRPLGSDVQNDRPRRVLVVSEHVGQFETLLYGFCASYRLPAEELKQRVLLYHAARLALTELQHELRHVIRQHVSAGEEPPLVILDTAAASFDLEDENDNAAVGAMLAELKQVVLATGAPIWIIAHAAKALGRHDAEITPRGASAYIGDAHGTGSVFREPDLPDWVFLRSLKNRAVRSFEEIGMQTRVEWHTTTDERGMTQQIGIRLGVPGKSGETLRKSAAQEHAHAARAVEEFALRVKAKQLTIDTIEEHGLAAIWSGSGASSRPDSIPVEAAITTPRLKAALGRGSSTVSAVMQELRTWASEGELHVEPRGTWWVLRKKAEIVEVAPGFPRFPRGFPEVSLSAQETVTGGAAGGGALAPAAAIAPVLPPREEVSPSGSLKGKPLFRKPLRTSNNSKAITKRAKP